MLHSDVLIGRIAASEFSVIRQVAYPPNTSRLRIFNSEFGLGKR
ncbi:hypothetical protein FDUTEX481_06482 [Tolypothrix sp. PCC 7601]|nr:hypothetical protein FDUTEX481_06482 [Tolypothrix sp. PCC 7601]